MGKQMPTGPKVAAGNDVYTALLFIAASLLLIGIIIIAYKSQTLLGSMFPSSAP